MKINRTFRKWIFIGLTEIIISLILFAIAPNLLNSDKPMAGFLIWLSVPTVLGGSGIYVGMRLYDANQARYLFVSRFPEYSDLKISDFLDIRANYVADNLEMLENAKNAPSLEIMDLSLLDILKG